MRHSRRQIEEAITALLEIQEKQVKINEAIIQELQSLRYALPNVNEKETM